MARLRRYVLAGLLVTAPLVATFWLVSQAISFVDARLRPLVPERWHPETYLGVALPGLELLAAIVLLVLVGFLATTYAGHLFTRLADALFCRVPVVRSIYGWIKQVFETVLSHKSSAFRQVVLVEYPRRGCWAVGFVTGRTEGEVQELTRQTVLNVFVPATPNVTTGFLLFIPEPEVVPLAVSVEEGIKLVVSGGIVVPRGRGTTRGLTPPPAETAAAVVEPPGTAARLRHCLLAGLLITGPVGLTLWLVWALVTFVDARVAQLVPAQWHEALGLPFVVPGVGLVVVLAALILVGMFATGYVGRASLRFGEGLVLRMPVIRSIYGAFKQIFETVLSQQSSSFRKVVLFEYPRAGSWSLGFLSGRAGELVDPGPEGESVNVFLPTTPNPTSGFLLFIPESRVEVLEMTVDEGLKMVVSGGLVTPRHPRPKREPSAEPMRATGR